MCVGRLRQIRTVKVKARSYYTVSLVLTRACSQPEAWRIVIIRGPQAESPLYSHSGVMGR